MTAPIPEPTVPSRQAAPRLSGAIIPVAGIVLVAAFFAAHQAWATGFFLPSFSPLLAGLFYASILYGIIVTGAGATGIRKDRILVLDLIGGILWTTTTVSLYVTFPFDFARLAAVVPTPLVFVVSWITQSMAKTIWLALVIGSAAFIPFFALQLSAARRRIRGRGN